MFTLYYGCMFAGKTTALLAAGRKAQHSPHELMVFKPFIDQRYNGNQAIVSHNQERLTAVPIDRPTSMLQHIDTHTRIVLIDELQFFDPSIVDTIEQMRKRSLQIIGAGLLLDYRKEIFGSMDILKKIADKAVELFAACELCGADAQYTFRKVQQTDLISPGGSEQYSARCSSCFDEQ